MHHKCTACGQTYEEGQDILGGCNCGNKLFFFVKDKAKKPAKELNYFYELEDDDNNEIMIFDLETINIIENGKYEIDLDSLMKSGDECLVYKYGEGKYSIDIEQNFSKIKYKRE
jgi:predicted  nucleic acid-binding Zn-ribbon protein